MAAIAPVSNFGFGDYALPEGKTFAQMQTCAKVQKIFFAILYCALVTLSIVLIQVSLPIAVIGAAVFSTKAIQAILAAIGVFYRAQPMQGLFKAVEATIPPLNTLSDKPCSGFATKDGVESHQWKLNLIRAAKHTVFISGCYCGGKAFDETLDLIRERMRLFPRMNTSILSSDMFVTNDNYRRIQEMEKEFGNRFSCIVTWEGFPYVSPTTDRLSVTTNHTKALVIDYGAAFMVGGSGIVSPWSQQKGEAATEQIENHGIIYDYLLKVRAYRDMDFVFQAADLNGIGTRLYVEMTKLHERFRYPTELPIPFTNWPARIEPMAMPRQIDNLKIACYATGPEQTSNAFHDDLVAEVKKAKKSIVIEHMYFHPTKELLQALINASNRGIEITLITNKLGSRSPGSHLTYAELSRYNAKALFEGKEKPNVEHHEFDVPYTTFHKKLICIDGKILFNGSANIGKKSLDGSDYEIDFKVESEEFATSLVPSIEADKALCKKDPSPHISLKTRIFSTVQTLCTPFL